MSAFVFSSIDVVLRRGEEVAEFTVLPKQRYVTRGKVIRSLAMEVAMQDYVSLISEQLLKPTLEFNTDLLDLKHDTSIEIPGCD